MVFTIDTSIISKDALLEAVGQTQYKATVVGNEVAAESDSSGEEQPKRVAAPAVLMEALGQAQARNVPLMIEFSAPWCGTCQKLKKETLEDETVAKLIENNAVLLEIDADEHADIAKQFGVQALPEIVFLSPQGRELKRISGFEDKDTFTVSFRSVLEDVPAVVDFGPRLLTDLADNESQLKQQFNDDAAFVRMIVILSPS